MITQYSEFILEKAIYDMILESTLIYSKNFTNILNNMRDNKIAEILLSYQNKDVDGLIQNYIDISTQKDEITFTPDRRAIEFLANSPKQWEVIESGKYLTHSDKNDAIFKRLGYSKEGRDCWAPSVGTKVKILAETVSKSTQKVYCMVEGVEGNDNRIGVINKTALEEENQNKRIWNTSRNPFKINRFVRAFLTNIKYKFTDKEIEDFGNIYKSTFDYMNDILLHFDVVKGEDIKHWYDGSNYQRGGGTLNNSCMANVESDFLSIYSDNKNISLVILYDDNGVFKDAKYTSSKIKGRAILWDCQINGKKEILMDRIYTVKDEDVELFKKMAYKNGWWHKKYQNIDEDGPITNGKEDNYNPLITCVLNYSEFDYYPYLDTLCYLNTGNDIISNSADEYINRYRNTHKLRCTDGTSD